jgi:hypothetical protein
MEVIIGAFILWVGYLLYLVFYKGLGERHYDRYGKDFPGNLLSMFGKKVYVILMKLFYISLFIYLLVIEIRLFIEY